MQARSCESFGPLISNKISLAIGSGPGDRQEAMHGGVATGHRSATIELGHMVGEWGWRSTKEWQAAIVEHTDAGWGRVGMSAHFECSCCLSLC